jgi:hypothetical protein
MRKVPYLFLAASLLGCAAYASAAEPGSPESAKKEQLTVEEMRELEGAYALADGRIMQLKMIDDRLYLDVGRRGQWQLLRTGVDTLATKDNRISIVFKRADNDEIVLSYDTPSKLAK